MARLPGSESEAVTAKYVDFSVSAPILWLLWGSDREKVIRVLKNLKRSVLLDDAALRIGEGVGGN